MADWIHLVHSFAHHQVSWSGIREIPDARRDNDLLTVKYWIIYALEHAIKGLAVRDSNLELLDSSILKFWSCEPFCLAETAVGLSVPAIQPVVRIIWIRTVDDQKIEMKKRKDN